MPIYRVKGGHIVPQSFAPAGSTQIIRLALNSEQIRLKTTMRDAHASQHQMLANFRLDVEQFRYAPAYDFRLPANGGQLLYERFDWGLNGRQWRDIVSAVLERIRTGRAT